MHRDFLAKFSPQKLGRLYYCPTLVQEITSASGSNNNQKKSKQQQQLLAEQWSQHWNMSKPVLIQKTPSFDVLFL